MNRILISAAFLAASMIAAPAIAADMQRPVYKASPPVVTIYDWSGFYAGVNGGWGQSVDDLHIGGSEPIGRALVSTGLIPGQMTTRIDGWNVGGQVGWRKQWNWFVGGIDIAANYADISGSANDLTTLAPLGLPVSLGTTTNTKLEWFATVAGTAGIAIDRLLIYGKGGVAFGDVSTTVSSTLKTPIPVLNATATGNLSSKDVGFVVGGGLEYALAQSWTLGLEYQYLDFGSSSTAYNTTILGTKVGFNAERDNTFHIVNARLNYRF